MRLGVVPLISLCFFTLQACAVDSAEGVKRVTAADASAPRGVEALLFGMLPGPGIAGGGGGGRFVRKQGQVDCVVRNTPPGGPVATTVSCNAAAATAMLREDEARQVYDFLSVEARPTESGGMRKEAFVECYRTAIAAPGGRSSTETTCTSR